jgi:hypothetical protein
MSNEKRKLKAKGMPNFQEDQEGKGFDPKFKVRTSNVKLEI